jgi:hypothetical protein
MGASATLGTGKSFPAIADEDRQPDREPDATPAVLTELRKRPGFVQLFARGSELGFGVACMAARQLNIPPHETAERWDEVLDRAIELAEGKLGRGALDKRRRYSRRKR